MKLIIKSLIILSLLCPFLNANEINCFSLALTASPNLVKSFSEGTHPASSYDMGLTCLYNLSAHYSIESGLNYSTEGYDFGWKYMDPIGHVFSKIFYWSFIEIPIGLRYSFFEHQKLLPYISINLLYQTFINFTVDVPHNTVIPAIIERQDNFSLNPKLGLSYYFNNNIFCTANLFSKYYLLSYFQYFYGWQYLKLNDRLYQIGLAIGFGYNF